VVHTKDAIDLNGVLLVHGKTRVQNVNNGCHEEKNINGYNC
jgi:hypothetical protein